jgi:hypothetical protein
MKLFKKVLLTLSQSLHQQLSSLKTQSQNQLLSKIFKRKKRKNPYNITDLKNLEVKKLKKATNSEPIQQESIQIDQTGEGFWSFYKK